MKTQQERVALSLATPNEVINSSIIGLFDGALNRYVVDVIRFPVVFVTSLVAQFPPIVAALVLLVLGALGPTHMWGEKAAATPNWHFYVALPALLTIVGQIIDYYIEVVVRVPLRAPFKYPLIRVAGGIPRRDTENGFLLMIVGFMGMLPTLAVVVVHHFWPQPAAYLGGGWPGGVASIAGFDTYLFFFVGGVYLAFLGLREPAWPFIRLTKKDDLLAAEMSPFRPQRHGNEQAPERSTPTAQHAKQETQKPQQTQEDYEVPFSARKPRKTFDDIYGMKELKEKLLAPALAIVAPRIQQDENGRAVEAPRNGILMHGEPGNGKTVMAEALAGELGVPFIEVTYGPMASKWVGQEPAMMTRTFELARKCAPCVLFLDEIDSFIKSRDSGSSNPEYARTTNVVLTEIVKLRDSQVVVIGATNFLDQLDAAAVREGRFDFKVEITPPDEVARIGLLESGLLKHAPQIAAPRQQLEAVAKRWNGFSVARLNAICKAVPDVAKKHGIVRLGHAEFMLALREVQGRRGRLPTNTKSLSEMVFESETQDALSLIAARLKNIEKIELRGGSLPGGILFSGPPGTGKTAAARALAKEAGWAFLNVAGPDLVADRSKLSAIFREAKDLRPTIIFVDEADEILRNRQYSHHSDMVNKLLTIMDGAEDKVKDLIWIAATNHPENVDPALLRAGRFSEKIHFNAPPQEGVVQHIKQWISQRNIVLEHGLSLADLATAFEGQTIANVEGALQYALNASINRNIESTRTVIRREDVEKAFKVVISHL